MRSRLGACSDSRFAGPQCPLTVAGSVPGGRSPGGFGISGVLGVQVQGRFGGSGAGPERSGWARWERGVRHRVAAAGNCTR